MVSYSELVSFLRSHGYTEQPTVRVSGDFAVRGDLIECWPVTEEVQFRLHFFGEELERIERALEDKWQTVSEFPNLLPNQLQTEHGTIRPGEYVVHPYHGVGIFSGLITQKNIEGVEVQYVALEYAGNDRLLVPIDRYGELMPYIGGRHPRLTRLYSKSWANTKERVQRDLIAVARGLLTIYAERQISKRHPYARAADWLDILAKGVPFSLTEDQQRSLDEILSDLEASPHPMDRLLCGDVGFGKTEVALRAAAEVMAAGKQVAFIAPTTVLVEQHFTLLQQRFADLPVKIAHMSRLTAGGDVSVRAQLAEGGIDMVVGTHRLLGKSVTYKDLGLLIVDEEQKFGVTHKEQLKKIRPHLDVLSLSATPIPRTLSMSLSGLRGLSMLRTAPQGRLPIQTEVEPYTDTMLKKVLLAELDRGGQIYVVHNRVQSLHSVELRVLKMLSGTKHAKARVAIAHGQLHETALAQSMAGFMKGEIDILVASSIVEHGLDSPKANTLVVLHSEWFGLSDLYQLRGRVGRRSTQAFAYFFTGGIERSPFEQVGEVNPIGDTARLRLAALKEADMLGSGWSIALRDLEIRGGGNILGNEQHGSMEAIGLLLYAQLLQEEIGRQAKERGITLFSKPTL